MEGIHRNYRFRASDETEVKSWVKKIEKFSISAKPKAEIFEVAKPSSRNSLSKTMGNTDDSNIQTKNPTKGHKRHNSAKYSRDFLRSSRLTFSKKSTKVENKPENPNIFNTMRLNHTTPSANSDRDRAASQLVGASCRKSLSISFSTKNSSKEEIKQLPQSQVEKTKSTWLKSTRPTKSSSFSGTTSPRFTFVQNKRNSNNRLSSSICSHRVSPPEPKYGGKLEIWNEKLCKWSYSWFVIYPNGIYQFLSTDGSNVSYSNLFLPNVKLIFI